MANSNPDFKGGPTQAAPATLGEGTPVNRSFTKPTPTRKDLERHVNNMGPGPSENEASEVDPEVWDSVQPMKTVSRTFKRASSSPQDGPVPEGGNQLRQVNPLTTQPTREDYPSSGRSRFESGIGDEPEPVTGRNGG